ncbi:hypothetical protein ACS0PU_009864 [Formica fusca]
MKFRDVRGISTDQEERRRVSQARLSTTRWSRLVARDVAAGAAAAAGTIVGFILKGRDTHGRHDPAADCRRTSSYEKLALPLPPLTVPKTRSSAGLSSLFLSSNLSLRPLALVLYHRSTPSLRAFAIRGGVLFSAEGGSLLLLRMESRTGPGDIFGFFFRYVVLRLARSHPV